MTNAFYSLHDLMQYTDIHPRPVLTYDPNSPDNCRADSRNPAFVSQRYLPRIGACTYLICQHSTLPGGIVLGFQLRFSQVQPIFTFWHHSNVNTHHIQMNIESKVCLNTDLGNLTLKSCKNHPN